MQNKQVLLSVGLLGLILFLVIQILTQSTNQKEQVVFEDLKMGLKHSQNMFAKNSDSLVLVLHDIVRLNRPDDQPIAETVKYIQEMTKRLIHGINKLTIISKDEMSVWEEF